MQGEHTINIQKGTTAVAQGPRKFPFGIQERLKEELLRLQKLQLIEPVDRPTPWVSQKAIVVKKDGSLRIYLDPRERYHLPKADECTNVYDYLMELSVQVRFSTEEW